MSLANKMEHILRCIKLGMELFKAEMVAECTPEEMEVIEKDEDFMVLVAQQYAMEEYDLLKKHSMAMEIATTRGNASAAQWKLGKINPGRWGSREGNDFLEGTGNYEVNLVGVDPKENASD